jgi:hypothetical protein
MRIRVKVEGTADQRVRELLVTVLGALPLLSLWVALSASPIHAQTPVVRYFVSAGVHPWLPHGDLGGRGRSTLEAESGQEETLIPGPQFFTELEFGLGARVDASTVSLQLGLAGPDTEIQPDAVRTVQSSWLRFDFVYMYSFRHRDEWQPRLGVGYGFSRLQVPQASLRRNGATGSALFSGSGPLATLGVGWFPWRYGGFTLDARYRLVSITHLTNSEGEFFALDDPLREGMVGLGFSAVWVF